MQKKSPSSAFLSPYNLSHNFLSVRTLRKVTNLILLLTLFITILTGSAAFAQNSTSGNSQKPLKYTFSQFGKESWDFVKQPTKWDGSDWLKIGLVGAGTFLIIETADQPIRTAVLKEPRYYQSVPGEFGRVWGEIYSPIIFFAGFAIHSLITNDIGTRKIGYEIGQASIYAGVLSFLLKLAIGRSRPYLNEGTGFFRPFSSIINQDNKSMPSGHSTVAFVISTILSRNVESPVLKVLAYLPAALTLVSRVYQDQHWASDTFAGAALGYFIATWVVDQHENNKSVVDMSSAYPFTISIAF